MTENVPRPFRNPPAEAWLAVKPIFLDLYLRQDRTLDEVRHYLQSRHSFVASTKAYKLRIKQWNALKYRKRQKPRVGATTKYTFATSATSNGARSSASQGMAAWQGQTSKVPGYAWIESFDAQKFTNSMICMDPRVKDTSSYLYAATRDFWRWTLQSTSSPQMDHVWSSHLAPSWMLVNAVTLLAMPSRHQQGQIKLLQAQEAISSTIKDAPAATLLAVASLFTFDKWDPYPGVQIVLFNFIKDYALRFLPSDHPLRKVFQHLKGDEMRYAAGRLFVVQVDTLMDVQKEGGEVPDWFYLGPTLGLIQARLLGDAHRVSVKRMQQASSTLKQCRILQLVVRCQYYSHDYDGSIKTGLKVLAMTDELRAEGNYVWGDIVGTYDPLAKSYGEKGDWDNAIKYYWLAFKTALHQYGQNATNAQYYCYELEQCLQEHGSAEELAMLKSDYPYMFSDNPDVLASAAHTIPPPNRKHTLVTSSNFEHVLQALINL